MLIIYLKELRRLEQERQAKMKYPYTSSRNLLARFEVEIKLQLRTEEPIERFDVWKASH